jgi:hypothetical protein
LWDNLGRTRGGGGGRMENIKIHCVNGFYSDTKNEILSFAGKWMELENIILSKVS